MRELFTDLKKHTHKTFKKHFLKSVHCELGISGISTESILSNETKLKEKLAPLGFKDNKKIHLASFVFNQQESDAKVTNQSTPLGLIFHSINPKRELQILNDKIVISDHAYQGFNSFSSTFKEVASIALEVLKIPTEINKVGFRKINSIFVEDTQSYSEAVAVFNPAIFSIPESGLIASDSLKGLENVIVSEKEKKTFILRGILAKQQKPDTYQGTLDFDLVNRNLIKFDEVFSSLLPEMNQLHFDLFMWAVTEDLIKVMEA